MSIKEDIQTRIIPFAQKRIKQALGVDGISFEVNWESFDKATNPEIALKTLHQLDGHFVFGRAAAVMEEWAKRSPFAKESLAAKIKKFIVKNVNEADRPKEDENDQNKRRRRRSPILPEDPRCIYDNGNITLMGDYSKGPFGGFTKKELSTVIGTRSGSMAREYIDQLKTKGIKRCEEEIQKALGLSTPIKVEVDWESFEAASNVGTALENFARWWGYGSYSLERVSYAFRSVINDEGITPYDIAETVHTIVFKNIPGDDDTKKCTYIKDGILYNCGVWEAPDYWYCSVSSEEIRMTIRHQCYLNKKGTAEYELAGKTFKELSLEQQKFKMKILEEAASASSTIGGNTDYLAWVVNQPCFWQPNEEEKKRITACWERIQHDIKALEEQKDQKKKNKNLIEAMKDEKFVKGWPFTKINFRGTRQKRIAIVTDKAFYTFAWNDKKDCPADDHWKRLPLDQYDRVRIGELKERINTGGLPGAGALGAAANAASAVASALKPKEGLIFETSIKNSKGFDPKAKIKSEIAKKLIPIVRKLAIDEGLAKMENLPTLTLPEVPKYTTTELMYISAKSMVSGPNSSNLPQVTVAGTQVDLINVCALLLEAFENLSREPTMKLSNVPEISLPYILGKTLEIVESMPNVDIGIEPGGSINLGRVLSKIVYMMKEAEKTLPGGLEIPAPGPIPLSQMFEEILNGLKNTKEINTMPEFPTITLANGASTPTVDVTQALEELIPQIKAADVTIEFEKCPPLRIIKTLEVVATVMAALPIPSIPLPDIPGLPSLDISLPGPLGTIINLYQQQAGRKPYYKEVLMDQPELEEGNAEWAPTSLLYEIAYTLWGCSRAASTPYYQWRPWKSTLYFESTTFGKLFGKKN